MVKTGFPLETFSEDVVFSLTFLIIRCLRPKRSRGWCGDLDTVFETNILRVFKSWKWDIRSFPFFFKFFLRLSACGFWISPFLCIPPNGQISNAKFPLVLVGDVRVRKDRLTVRLRQIYASVWMFEKASQSLATPSFIDGSETLSFLISFVTLSENWDRIFKWLCSRGK